MNGTGFYDGSLAINPYHYFNWHPLMMTLGFVFFYMVPTSATPRLCQTAPSNLACSQCFVAHVPAKYVVACRRAPWCTA